MARLRAAPVRPTEQKPTARVSRETPPKPTSSTARGKISQPVIILDDSDEEEAPKDLKEEKKRIDSLKYLDLSAEEADTDDSEHDSANEDEYGYEISEEESNTSDETRSSPIAKENGTMKEDIHPNGSIDTISVKHQKRKTLRTLGVSRANTLYKARRVSAREERRYSDFAAGSSHISTERGDYEKENDEKGLFNETKHNLCGSRSRRNTGHARKSGRGTWRPSVTPQYVSEKEEILSSENEEEEEEFDSLEGFIVGDEEDISYYESAEEESEESEEEIFTKQKVPVRRLFRGRRPTVQQQDKEAARRNTKIFLNTTDIHNSSQLDHLTEALNKTTLSPTELQQPTSIDQEYHCASRDNKKTTMNPVCESDSDTMFTPPLLDPTPAQNVEEVFTPPGTPSKSRLQSPKKTPKRIPQSPYRPSIDAFWSQNDVNHWNDLFTPKTPFRASRKLLPEFTIFEDSQGGAAGGSSSVPSSPGKSSSSPKKGCERSTRSLAVSKAEKRAFDEKKMALGEAFLKELDDRVSGGQIRQMVAETGGVQLIWCKKLNKTAGVAIWKREHIKQKEVVQEVSSEFTACHQHNNSFVTTSPTTSPLKSSYIQYASIKLADKVVDTEEKLLNTIAHEYCHLANYMISKVRDNPHGASFKNWAKKVMAILDAHPVYAGRIQITTKHSYKINYKYIWSCLLCAQEYGRHSKSIDPAKSGCGRCKGTLVQIQPKPRKATVKTGENVEVLD
ncbi:hypothetical protein LOZ65_005438 [Ophidiomyces ophidiicola]|nr:hypothetical protein LOZ65_005438 [Ophidiomyces ophidiicola]